MQRWVYVLWLMIKLVTGSDEYRRLSLDSYEYQELTTSFQKSANDDREYLGLELSNQMKVLLISDPKADLAAAALDVAVGSMSDPDSMPGLAHFCEHLLFMGNEKYPSVNAYFSHLKSNGGVANAYTSYEHTNYYFSVGHQELEKTLDIFSQFFISPLFANESIAKEVNAVNSEYLKNLQSDPRRIRQVQLATLNHSHPFTHFSTGNYDTLFKTPREASVDPRQQVVDFYSKFYSANQMRLVVVGRESLEELKLITIPKFTNVPNTNVTRPSVPYSPFSSDTLGVEIDIVPVEKIQRIVLQFPLPSQFLFYKEKPTLFISYFLGHHGPGSAFAHLKEMEWASSISAYLGEDFKDFSVFEVALDLTPQGLNNTQTIVQLILDHISFIKDRAITKEYFDEISLIKDNHFRFLERSNSATYASNLANIMHHSSPLAETLSGTYLMTHFDPDLIKDMLEYLTKDNLRLTILANFTDAKLTEPWYNTKYALKKLPKFNPTTFKLQLPPPNPYIPNNFDIADTKPEMQLLRNTSQAILWYAGNPTRTPKANICLLLKNNIVSSSSEMRAHADLLLGVIISELNEFGYNAILAGLDYKIQVKESGLLIVVDGFSQKIESFLSEILILIKNAQFSNSTFDLTKQMFLQSLANSQTDKPYQQGISQTKIVLLERIWPNDMLLMSTAAVSFNSLQAFAKSIFSTSQLEMLVTGNLEKLKASQIMDSSIKTLHSSPPPQAQLQPIRNFILPRGDFFTQSLLANTNDPNSAIVYYLDMYAYPDTFTRTATLLLSQILSEPTFHQLRTKEQLGYIVKAKQYELATRGGIMIYIQSEYDPVYLESRIENLLANFETMVTLMPDEKFQTHVAAVKSKILEKQRTLKETTDHIWSSIYSGYYDFTRGKSSLHLLLTLIDNTTITCLNQITPTQLLSLVQTKIIRNAPKRTKFSTHIVAANPTPPPQFNFNNCGSLVANITQWRIHLPLSPYPTPLQTLS